MPIEKTSAGTASGWQWGATELKIHSLLGSLRLPYASAAFWAARTVTALRWLGQVQLGPVLTGHRVEHMETEVRLLAVL